LIEEEEERQQQEQLKKEVRQRKREQKKLKKQPTGQEHPHSQQKEQQTEQQQREHQREQQQKEQQLKEQQLREQQREKLQKEQQLREHQQKEQQQREKEQREKEQREKEQREQKEQQQREQQQREQQQREQQKEQREQREREKQAQAEKQRLQQQQQKQKQQQQAAAVHVTPQQTSVTIEHTVEIPPQLQQITAMLNKKPKRRGKKRGKGTGAGGPGVAGVGTTANVGATSVSNPSGASPASTTKEEDHSRPVASPPVKPIQQSVHPSGLSPNSPPHYPYSSGQPMKPPPAHSIPTQSATRTPVSPYPSAPGSVNMGSPRKNQEEYPSLSVYTDPKAKPRTLSKPVSPPEVSRKPIGHQPVPPPQAQPGASSPTIQPLQHQRTSPRPQQPEAKDRFPPLPSASKPAEVVPPSPALLLKEKPVPTSEAEARVIPSLEQMIGTAFPSAKFALQQQQSGVEKPANSLESDFPSPTTLARAGGAGGSRVVGGAAGATGVIGGGAGAGATEPADATGAVAAGTGESGGGAGGAFQNLDMPSRVRLAFESVRRKLLDVPAKDRKPIPFHQFVKLMQNTDSGIEVSGANSIYELMKEAEANNLITCVFLLL
jgi:chemotaxis protein histidine kinase CheA